MTTPTTKTPAISQNDKRKPAKNASATASGPRGETASRLGSTPLAPMVVTTTVVAKAMLVTLAELRVS